MAQSFNTAGAYRIWAGYADEYATMLAEAMNDGTDAEQAHWLAALREAKANMIGFASYDNMMPLHGRVMPA